MQDKDGFIWLDGHWLPWREARVHVLTHTLHYGYGCFEGLRAYATPAGPAIFRLAEHLRRLEESAHILAIDLPFDRATLAAACREAKTWGHEERRRRKLLVSKRELSRLWNATAREGMTIVPMKWYFNERGIVKIKLGIAKGKKLADKRQTEAKRDWDRQKQRLLRHGS